MTQGETATEFTPGGMMTSSNGNIFRITGPLCWEFTGPRWIPLTKASDAGLWCFSLISPWTNDWVDNWDAGDLRRHRVHYDVTVMRFTVFSDAQTGNQLTWFTNPTMQRFHIPQCTIQNRNVYMMGYGTSALWDLWDCIFDWCYLLWVRLEVNGAYLKLHWILGNLYCTVISGDW